MDFSRETQLSLLIRRASCRALRLDIALIGEEGNLAIDTRMRNGRWEVQGFH